MTGKVLPDGETGALVFTTLRKEGAPLIRYETHDLTRIIPGDCPCGSKHPRIDTILGRTDDMVKIKGVGIYPGLVDVMLAEMPFASSEFRLVIDRDAGKDVCVLDIEVVPGTDITEAAEVLRNEFKKRVGIYVEVKTLNVGALPRSEGKTKRVINKRNY